MGKQPAEPYPNSIMGNVKRNAVLSAELSLVHTTMQELATIAQLPSANFLAERPIYVDESERVDFFRGHIADGDAHPSSAFGNLPAKEPGRIHGRLLRQFTLVEGGILGPLALSDSQFVVEDYKAVHADKRYPAGQSGGGCTPRKKRTRSKLPCDSGQCP
jgi:hypothetical protein